MTVTGRHEPNVILKDNDLKHKIRLPQEAGRALLTQLKKDAQFLYSIGVMDYSLLVGVHNTEYAVDGESSPSEVSASSPVTSPSSGSHEKRRGSVLRPMVSRLDASFSFSPSIVAGDITADDRPSNVTSLSVAANPMQAHAGSRVSPLNGHGLPESEPQSTLAESGSVTVSEAMYSRRHEVSRVVGPEAYYMGIVDFQQQWDLNKKVCDSEFVLSNYLHRNGWHVFLQMERFFKIHFKGADPDGLSAIEPETYRDRCIIHMCCLPLKSLIHVMRCRFLRRMEELLDVEPL